MHFGHAFGTATSIEKILSRVDRLLKCETCRNIWKETGNPKK